MECICLLISSKLYALPLPSVRRYYGGARFEPLSTSESEGRSEEPSPEWSAFGGHLMVLPLVELSTLGGEWVITGLERQRQRERRFKIVDRTPLKCFLSYSWSIRYTLVTRLLLPPPRIGSPQLGSLLEKHSRCCGSAGGKL